MVNELGPPPAKEEGDPVVEITVPNLPPGVKRNVMLQVRGPNQTFAVALRPELAEWIGNSIVGAAKVASSPIEIVHSMPTLGENGAGK